MKQKIMEALLNSDVNLSKTEISWLASHLPDNGEKGAYIDNSYHFNHDQNNLFDAVGCTDADAKACAEVLTEITKKCIFDKGYKVSHAVEEALNASKNHKAMFPLIISKTINEAVEQISGRIAGDGPSMSDIEKLIRAMRKRSDD